MIAMLAVVVRGEQLAEKAARAEPAREAVQRGCAISATTHPEPSTEVILHAQPGAIIEPDPMYVERQTVRVQAELAPMGFAVRMRIRKLDRAHPVSSQYRPNLRQRQRKPTIDDERIDRRRAIDHVTNGSLDTHGDAHADGLPQRNEIHTATSELAQASCSIAAGHRVNAARRNEEADSWARDEQRTKHGQTPIHVLPQGRIGPILRSDLSNDYACLRDDPD